MNHRPDTPEYKEWAKGNLVDTFVKKGVGPPLTCDVRKMEERIDYIFAAGPIADRLTKCRVLNEPPFNVDPKNKATFALSDHLPVVAEFKKE